ncbi:MAG: hypothetical protein ACRCSN_01295 [Dermatophilaceae bacterium]
MVLPFSVRAVAAVAVAASAVMAPAVAAARDVRPASSVILSPSPSPGPSRPSDAEMAEVAEAKRVAAAAASEVAVITAELDAAEDRLEQVQRRVSEVVAAHEAAQQQLAAADTAVRRATEELEAATHAKEVADRRLSEQAGLIYMQGGDLYDVTTLALTPPNVMSDLAVILDRNAHEVRKTLDAATSTAAAAAEQEQRLVAARDARAAAAADAARTRAAAEKKAAEAGVETARLTKQQEQLTARLTRLRREAEDLVARRRDAADRDAAAGRGAVDLLGVQADGSSSGTGPRAAQAVARSMMPTFGWDDAEFACIVELWQRESGWSWSATNPSSGAYGIPQSLPAWKMSSAGSDWLTNPATQIAWGLGYIDDVYGSPCAALDAWHSRSPHWY